MMRNLAFLPLAALMMACTPTPAVNETAKAPDAANEVAMPKDDAKEDMLKVCNAAPVQNLIGQTLTLAIGRDALARTGAKTLRVTKPGMAVTMDFRNDRLNIDVDDESVITAIRCG